MQFVLRAPYGVELCSVIPHSKSDPIIASYTVRPIGQSFWSFSDPSAWNTVHKFAINRLLAAVQNLSPASSPLAALERLDLVL